MSKHIKERKFKFQNKKLKKLKQNDEISAKTALYSKIESNEIKKFSDFPLSRLTLEGLKNANYLEPTEIQRESIGLALRGLDVLGAALTGSGKTLAFVIPVLECLWRNRWTKFDGLGALIISPTRELALQTYEVLCKVGCKHDFSAALIIGGTDVAFQKERISRSNIIVCTPGRILQHMDENPLFNCDNLQILVLDEADRILDMGFQQQLNALVQNLPQSRQTLLFSATQTKSVKDLARLSLKDPVYVSVHEHAEYSTPARLRQCYMVCEEQEKINILWSFLKNHLHTRIIIFFTNCKQVRFVYEAFRRFRPGMTVLALHGSMNQMKRVNVYEEFCKKKHAALFATDVAARGLDFPDVDWVYQYDCPSDATEYIHRSGRTARYSKDGEALLILTPSQEQPMLKELATKKVPIQRINPNRKKLFSIQKKLEILCARDPSFKLYAQRAFVAYMRSIVTMSNREIFNVKMIDHELLANSYGLVSAPRVRFLQKNQRNNKSPIDSAGENPGLEKARDSKIDNSNNLSKTAPSSSFGMNDEEIDENLDEFLIVKNKNVFAENEENSQMENTSIVNNDDKNITLGESKRAKRLTKSKFASKLLKKNIRINQKIVFEENEKVAVGNPTEADTSEKMIIYDIEDAKRRMQEEDKIDRENYRQKIKAKHREKRLAQKASRRKDSQQEKDSDNEVVLGIDKESDAESIDLSWLPDFDKIKPDTKNTKEIEENQKSPDVGRKRKRSKFEQDNETVKDKIKRKQDRIDEEFALSLIEH